ncbi:hypothetical protein PRIPAC_72794 [Pristionchus pacificus]|nr:hypothetical protein PRIPAC_72794 [Pristionchus pacificus]
MSPLLLLILFGSFFYYHFISKRRRFPPGPTPWPLIGNFAQMDLANPHRTILKWKEIYGPVFTIWLPKPIVVLASREVLEETLVKQAETFASRPSSFLYRMFTGSHHEGDGIILSSGERWQTQRQFALKTLKDFGFGRGEMEGRINFHLDRLLEQIEAKFYRRKISIQDPHEPLAFCIGNIIQDIVMGKVYDFGDHEFKHFKHLIDTVLAQVQSVQLLVADSFPFLARFLPGYHEYYKNGMALQNYFLREIDRHERVLSSDGPPRDFIEAYLREWKRHPTNRNFSKLTLALNSGDLWTGGMETTVTTIRWGKNRWASRC